MDERKGVSYMSELNFTKLMAEVSTPKTANLPKFFGLDVVSTPLMPNDIVRVVHVDGRMQIIKIDNGDYYADDRNP